MIIKSASDWLSNIWIIHKENGVCIFEQNFKNIETNSDLITGFIVAILNFGKEIADKNLQSIVFAGLKIMISIYDRFIIALAIDEDAPELDVKMFLEIVYDEFEKRYGNFLLNFNGDVSIFSDFESFIETLINKKAIAIEFLKNKIVKTIKTSDETKFIIEKIRKFDDAITQKEKELLLKNDKQKKISIEKIKSETFKKFLESWNKIKASNPLKIFTEEKSKN